MPTIEITSLKSPKEEYTEFLTSNFWLNLSSDKRIQVGNRCQGCGKKGKLECHHKFYREDWFKTKPDDLVVLCRFCHKAEHNAKTPIQHLEIAPLKNKPKRKKFPLSKDEELQLARDKRKTRLVLNSIKVSNLAGNSHFMIFS